jgi:hypothetical protein
MAPGADPGATAPPETSPIVTVASGASVTLLLPPSVLLPVTEYELPPVCGPFTNIDPWLMKVVPV